MNNLIGIVIIALVIIVCSYFLLGLPKTTTTTTTSTTTVSAIDNQVLFPAPSVINQILETSDYNLTFTSVDNNTSAKTLGLPLGSIINERGCIYGLRRQQSSGRLPGQSVTQITEYIVKNSAYAQSGYRTLINDTSFTNYTNESYDGVQYRIYRSNLTWYVIGFTQYYIFTINVTPYTNTNITHSSIENLSIAEILTNRL